MICRLLGVPDEDVANFVGYADALSPVFGFMDPEQVARADAAVIELMVDVERMIEQRADQRGDDLISALLDAEEDGERLTHDEVVIDGRQPDRRRPRHDREPDRLHAADAAATPRRARRLRADPPSSRRS